MSGVPAGRRRLGLTTAICLVVANMIGVGVFTTSGFALSDLGSPEWVLAAWAIGGVLAILGALCYGALSSRLLESGGEYLFLSRTIHPLAGFLAGWVSLLAGFTAPIAAAAAGLQGYVGPWFPWLGEPKLIGTAAILAAGVLHGRRLVHGARAQNVAVVIKLALIFAFIAYGLSILPSPSPETSEPASFTLQTFARALMFVSFSYSGWNAAVYIAGEVKNPTRNLPRALLLGAVTVMVVYLLLNAVFVYSAPVAELTESVPKMEAVGATAAEALGGEGLANFVRALIAIGLFTSVSSMVMIGPRVYAKMADDGVFPRMFAFTREVPAAAIWLQVLLAIIVLWITDLQQLLGYVGFTLSLSTAIAVVGLMVLRRKEGAEKVPIPGYPWVPLLFIITTLTIGGLLLSTGQSEPVTGLATIAVGVVVYFLVRQKPAQSSAS